MKGNIVRQILSDQANKNTRGYTRLNAAEIENEQFYFIYETKIFNSTLKKVPEQVESRAWAPLVTFFKRNIKNWSQSRDLTYDGDAISVECIDACLIMQIQENMYMSIAAHLGG